MKQIFLFLITTSFFYNSYACRCASLSFEKHVAISDNIFLGKVLKKSISDKVYYFFSITQLYKGEKTDTITIRTGFGSGDCGISFEIGKTYLVYANNKSTGICNRNSYAINSDIGKLKYLFIEGFSNQTGKDTDPIMTNNEADYFNTELIPENKNFDFHDKKISFLLAHSFIDKKQYFENWGGKEVKTNLIILTENEKQKTINKYDAIIVIQRKKRITKSFRNRLIKKLCGRKT